MAELLTFSDHASVKFCSYTSRKAHATRLWQSVTINRTNFALYVYAWEDPSARDFLNGD